MSDDKDDKDAKRAKVREAMGDAIANGQIHPALADYLALVDEDLQGVSDRHDALADDLAAREREEREAREGTPGESQHDPDDPGRAPDDDTETPPTTAKKATPTSVARKATNR